MHLNIAHSFQLRSSRQKACCVVLAMCFVLVLEPHAHASKLKIKQRGYVGMQSRAFLDDSNPATQDYGVNAIAQLQISAKKGLFKSKVKWFTIYDVYDQERGQLIVEEAWVEFKYNPLRLRIGVQEHNWAATEVFNPVDVMNSRYFDSDIENTQKIGEPTASMNIKLPIGRLSAHIMPFVTSPIGTSARSRQNFLPPGTALGRPLRLTRVGTFGNQQQFQWAMRLKAMIEALNMDITLHILQQQDRHRPLLVFNPIRQKLRPLYLPVTQTGGTLRMVAGDVVFKAEAAYRWYLLPPEHLGVGTFQNRDHALIAAGMDWGTAFENGAEITIFAEGQFMVLKDRALARTIDPFQADAIAGVRLNLNDEAAREFLALGMLDLERRDEGLISVSYSQRLGETFKLTLGARVILAPPRPTDPRAAPPVGLASLTDADLIQLSLVRYF